MARAPCVLQVGHGSPPRAGSNRRLAHPRSEKLRCAAGSVAPGTQTSGAEYRPNQLGKVLSGSLTRQFVDAEHRGPASDGLEETSPRTQEAKWSDYKKADAVVTSLVSEQKFDQAVEYLENCSEAGIVRDASLAQFLKQCYDAKRFDVTLRTVKRWIQNGQKDFRGYSANVACYCAFLSGDVDEGLWLIRTLHQQKIPTSDYPYSVSIHACNAQARWVDALDVYYLLNETSYPHRAVCRRNVLHTMRGGDYQVDFERLVGEVLEEWELVDFELYKALMETCKHFKDLQSAKELFETVYRRRQWPDVRCINALIAIYKVVKRLPPVEDLFLLLERTGLRPDVYTIGLLLGCACTTKQPVEVVDRILRQAEAWNVEHNCVVTFASCLAYKYAVDGSAEARIEKALNVLSSSQATDQLCYHVVMSMCIELGHLECALLAQKLMEKAGFASNHTTYRLLTHQCSAIGLVEQAAFYRDRMEEYLARETV